ncbi:COX15/CtaA family protein [Gordonia polyisoprenivorans]|uniref:COX15/CtaA family protein n=1 Tax=Gordonia polyisoprenivorans TaxID=84595 RepID=UPI001AD66BF0|nr:COX15/CtaA family protein [Gordonia polyisoprenivorans]QTI67072.1 heme A synthase [Gordonia polyisoprenivorans]
MTTSEKTPAAADRPAPVATTRSGLARVPGFGRPTIRFVHRWAIALLVANVGIVVTGGAVRLTGSGLGCPTWPQCTDGSFVPHEAMGYHAAIEFGNRMLTWVLTIIAIAAVVAVWRQASSQRRNRVLVVLLALGIPFQGVVGGITVLTDLNPWVVSLHFLLSMLLVSGATVLVFRTSPYPRESAVAGIAARVGLIMAWLVYAVTWIAIYLGTVVTGSGPHAGDVHAHRNGLTPSQTTQLHADSVFVLIGLAIAIVVITRVMRMPQSRAALTYAGLLVLQGIIGMVQYFTDLPILLVLLHMLGSGLLLIGATWLVLWFRLSDSPSGDPVPLT